MNNRSLDGQEVQGGRQPVQERTQCEIPKNFTEKWKTSQVYKLVIYRWNEYTSILKLCKVLGLWAGGKENPRCGPDFDIHLHFDGARQIQAVCFEAFSNGFFPVSPLGITLSVVQTKWPLYTEQAIRSASACLPAFLLGPLMRSVKPGCPFQPFVLATQFAPRRRISCQFKAKPNAFHLPDCDCACVCVCVWTF